MAAIDAVAAHVAGMVTPHLEEVIAGNDLLIASQVIALGRGHTLVTDNERELARIDEIVCEN